MNNILLYKKANDRVQSVWEDMKLASYFCYIFKIAASSNSEADAESLGDYDGHNGFADHFQNGVSTIVQIARRKGGFSFKFR